MSPTLLAAPARLAVLLALLGLVGCRDPLVGAEAPLLDLSPDLVGEWSGTYVGLLGLVGTDQAVLRDTFRLVFGVRKVGVEFVYHGEVLRGETAPKPLYDCGTALLPLFPERRLRFDCVQESRLNETRVLRVDVQADPAYTHLRGTVRDVLGAPGQEYVVDFQRHAR